MAICDEIRLLLGAFEDGELEPHEMHEVARHLAQCPACENEIAAYAEVGRLLRSDAPQPDLSGFTAAVKTRIGRLRPSPWTRLVRALDRIGDRATAGLALGAVAAAVAALTIVLVTPYAQSLMTRGFSHGAQVASRAASQAVSGAVTVPAEAVDTAADASETIISRLESQTPSVAVWSAPESDTTVIWVPDQP